MNTQDKKLKKAFKDAKNALLEATATAVNDNGGTSTKATDNKAEPSISELEAAVKKARLHVRMPYIISYSCKNSSRAATSQHERIDFTHTYIHTYIHTCIHTYITNIEYIHTCIGKHGRPA